MKAAILFAALVLAAPLAAEECDRPLEQIVATHSAFPSMKLVKLADGILAEQVIAFINRQPPQSEYAGDAVAIFYDQHDGYFRFVISAAGCVKTLVMMPAVVFGGGEPI
jgi:hypothetical protein